MVSKGRLLVVDDLPRNVELIAVRLRERGYEVVEAFDGEQALRIAEQQVLDLVLTDAKLPRMDGFELTRRLKSHPRLGGLPVVLVTALESTEDKVGVLDLDHFKRVNDEHGHLTGDAVLHELAQIMREGARQYDLVCRYGGEGFVLLLPATPPRDAGIVAERLRERVAEHGFADLAPGAVTASIGIASWMPEDTEPRLIFERADRAMYQAKEAGRNRVVSQ